MSLPTILRHTRAAQGVSQLELAMRLGISQRHISFLETGRSGPSRDLLLAWMHELAAPASVLNAALTLAGFSRIQPGTDVETQAAAECAAAAPQSLRSLIEMHDPMPAFIFSSDWNIVGINAGGSWMCSILMPRYRPLLSDGLDMVDALAHDNGLLSRMREAPRVGTVLLRQLQRESWVRPSLVDKAARLECALKSRFGPLPQVDAASFSSAVMHFETELGVLGFTAFQTVIATPEDVGSATLRIELWYPLDQATRSVVEETASRAAQFAELEPILI